MVCLDFLFRQNRFVTPRIWRNVTLFNICSVWRLQSRIGRPQDVDLEKWPPYMSNGGIIQELSLSAKPAAASHRSIVVLWEVVYMFFWSHQKSICRKISGRNGHSYVLSLWKQITPMAIGRSASFVSTNSLAATKAPIQFSPPWNLNVRCKFKYGYLIHL